MTSVVKHGRQAARTATALLCLKAKSFSSAIQSQPVDVDSVIIGAGVVGLAIARELSLRGHSVVIVEKEPHFGTATSSRNSEVIHAGQHDHAASGSNLAVSMSLAPADFEGISQTMPNSLVIQPSPTAVCSACWHAAGLYYPPGSLKARCCVEGKALLYDYCNKQGIAHKRIGKLIVAASKEQVPALHEIKARASACGVHDLQLLESPGDVVMVEPYVTAAAALLSPSTGIVDSHGLMVALLGDAESNGATLAVNSKVVGGDVRGAVKAVEVEDAGSGSSSRVLCRNVVNAAGLNAQEVAGTLQGVEQSSIPATFYAKGTYFAIQGRVPFRRLIYPLPEPGGLGVHLTLDLAGQAKLGPDVQWVDTPEYTLDPTRAEHFYQAVRKYWWRCPDGCLSPGYTGVRPKLVGPGAPAADFMVQGPEGHGCQGLVNLFGIESPGLTASLSLAKYVARKLTQ